MKTDIERINLLNQGLEEAKNLSEGLKVDFNILIKNIFPELIFEQMLEKQGITKKMAHFSNLLYKEIGFDKAFEICNISKSDTIRSLACFLIALNPASLHEKIQLIQPLANDPHFGVREWAWLALRPEIALNIYESIELMQPLTLHESENIRRFASEITRPRGVWCQHIKELKEQPWLAENLLNNLKADNAKYVQLSVGNWLNDAGKSQAEWVINLCSKWQNESNNTNTKKICKRALRNLN